MINTLKKFFKRNEAGYDYAAVLDFPRIDPRPIPPKVEEPEPVTSSVLTTEIVASIEELDTAMAAKASDDEDESHCAEPASEDRYCAYDSEENYQKDERNNDMAQHNDCHDHRKDKYFCFNPPPSARVGTYYQFSSFCCDDHISMAAQEFYDFAIMKKVGNPAIEKVELIDSPNGATKIVIIHWQFVKLIQLIKDDAIELWEKYLELLGY